MRAIMLYGLLCSSLQAECVYVTVDRPDGVRGHGSGCTIGALCDGRQAVLTAAHVLRDARAVHVHWSGGVGIEATVLATAHTGEMDVALLAASLPAAASLSLMPAPPSKRTMVTVLGHPGGRPLKTNRGIFWESVVVRVTPHSVEQGMSGGAVICGRQLAGIVSGFERTRPGNCIHTPAWLIRPWLEGHLGYLPVPSDAHPSQ